MVDGGDGEEVQSVEFIVGFGGGSSDVLSGPWADGVTFRGVVEPCLFSGSDGHRIYGKDWRVGEDT